MTEVAKYLRTLRRVPDDVIASTAARDLHLGSGQQCLCGWFVREQVGRMNGTDPEQVAAYDEDAPEGAWSPAERSRILFGGTQQEWYDIYGGVLRDDDVAAIETAFTIRVMEAVGVAR